MALPLIPLALIGGGVYLKDKFDDVFGGGEPAGAEGQHQPINPYAAGAIGFGIGMLVSKALE